MDTRTFAELESDCVGTVYHDEERVTSDGRRYRFMILRTAYCLCAYIGVPAGHPYWGKGYDDVDIPCHGGLTFGEQSDAESPLPAGYWWLGWDYAHLADRLFGISDFPLPPPLSMVEWTVPLVLADAERTLCEFERAGAQV